MFKVNSQQLVPHKKSGHSKSIHPTYKKIKDIGFVMQHNEAKQKSRIENIIESLIAVDEEKFVKSRITGRMHLLNSFVEEDFKYPEKYFGENKSMFENMKMLNEDQRFDVIDRLRNKLDHL